MSERRELAKAEVNPMALLQAAIDKGVNPDQLEKLIALQERWDRSRAAERFAGAIGAFQAECPVVMKARDADLGRYEYKFADYGDVMAEAGPLLRKYGIVVTFTTAMVASLLSVVCRVRVGTHVEETRIDLPIPNVGANDAQKFGAAVSYGKRYSICAALNIVVSDRSEDDDANSLHKITREQVGEVERMLVETGADREKFLNWAGGIRDVRDMTAAWYPKALNELKRKKAANAEKKGAKS